jgi:hypothetical protein
VWHEARIMALKVKIPITKWVEQAMKEKIARDSR